MQRREGTPITARGSRGLLENDRLALGVRSLGAVAAVAGARGVVLGAREVTSAGPVPAAIDSEYRFYAAWYLTTGVAIARRGAPVARGEIPFVSAGLWTAAAGRVLSLTQTGRPTRGQLVLLGVELALPLVLLSWQRRAARSEA